MSPRAQISGSNAYRGPIGSPLREVTQALETGEGTREAVGGRVHPHSRGAATPWSPAHRCQASVGACSGQGLSLITRS